MLGTPDGSRRVGVEDVAANEPIEQHSQCGQVLLDGRPRTRVLLDIGCDHDRLELFETREPVIIAPDEELRDRAAVRRASLNRLAGQAAIA